MTLEELSALLRKHDTKALVVHCFEGRWLASVRTSKGVTTPVGGTSMLDAVQKLVEALS